ncbi:MAG TPA: hypothetical protein VMH04_13110 [Candidatus Solibacter sp.]|nr:hypothetical protein [Candidatus Solibacter sp.]
MALLPMPKPSKNAWNPDRPMSSLLKWQVEHLHAAEMRMPLRYHTEIYVNALRSEGDAAHYIQAVTEAIHRAHADFEAAKVKPIRRGRKPVIEIAAVADEAAERRLARKTKVKKKSAAKKRAKR